MASDRAGRVSEGAGRASDGAGRASEGSGRGSKEAGRTSEGAKRALGGWSPGGWDGQMNSLLPKSRCSGTVSHHPLQGCCLKTQINDKRNKQKEGIIETADNYLPNGA